MKPTNKQNGKVLCLAVLSRIRDVPKVKTMLPKNIRNTVRNSVANYITDAKAALRLSDRDSKGRFVKGNKYRLCVTQIPVTVQSGNVSQTTYAKVTTFPNKAVLYHV